jgi:pyruvate kinase
VPGDILLLDDGRVQLKVLEVQGMKVFTEVTVGGPLSNNKGINKLGGGLSAEALTDKDKADIVTAAKIGVDYLAVLPALRRRPELCPPPGARCRLRCENRRQS